MNTPPLSDAIRAAHCGQASKILCPAHPDRSPSLDVAPGEKAVVMFCRSAGCKTEDIMRAAGLPMSALFPAKSGTVTEAKLRPSSVENEWTAIPVAPEAASADVLAGSHLGMPVATWEYCRPSGSLAGYVCRWNTPTAENPHDKTFRQLAWCRHVDGRTAWRWKWFAKPRPLYRGEELAKRPGAPVLVVEGEKTADAAQRLLPDYVVVTWPGGSSNVPPSESWTSLVGRDVVLWPDHDDAGRKAMAKVAEFVPQAHIVPVPEGAEKGWDLGDAEAEGWDTGKVLALVDQEQPSAPPAPAAIEAADSPAFQGVRLPGGSISFSSCAAELFGRLAKTKQVFNRGGAIVELVHVDGVAQLDIIKPDAFRSRCESVGPLLATVMVNGIPALKRSTMSRDAATALMATQERETLPPIASVVRCPAIALRDGRTEVLGQGYHRDNGGILVTENLDVSGWDTMPLSDAVVALTWLVREVEFQSPGDRARALAAFLTPALRMGGLLRGPIPVDVAEADQSQAGKGYRHQLVSAIYNETPYVVVSRNGGVGSTDESFAAALVAGRPFIQLDNFRGKLDSQMLESFLTCAGPFPARVPHRGEVQVDAKRFLLQLSSNGLEATRDFANRSSICRIRKRPGFAYSDTLGEIHHAPGFYLGAVFRIVREWIDRGMPKTDERRHDFRDWAQSLDWISQNILGAGSLLDGHAAAQERTSNPALTWLRSVALAVGHDNRLGEQLSASTIVELCGEHGLDVPGGSPDEEKAARAIGSTMKRLFAIGDELEVDGFHVHRGRSEYRKESGDKGSRLTYQFARHPTQPPNTTQPL